MRKRNVDLNSLYNQRLNSLKKDVNRQLRNGCNRGSTGRKLTLDDAKELWQQKEKIEALQSARGISLKQSVDPELSIDDETSQLDDETPQLDDETPQLDEVDDKSVGAINKVKEAASLSLQEVGVASSSSSGTDSQEVNQAVDAITYLEKKIDVSQSKAVVIITNSSNFPRDSTCHPNMRENQHAAILGKKNGKTVHLHREGVSRGLYRINLQMK